MHTQSYSVRPRDREKRQSAILKKQNEFLDVYSLYQRTKIAWVHDILKLKAYELHLLDPSFKARL